MEDLNLNVNDQNQPAYENVKEMNVFQRFIAVFFSPGQLMKYLEEKPKVLMPIILMMIAPVLLLIARYSNYMDLLMKQTELQLQKMGQEIPPNLNDMISLNAKIGIVSTSITAVIVWIIGTAILFGVVKAFKGEGKFKQYCSVTANAWVIMVLYYIVTGVVSYVTNALNMQIPVTSLASLLPSSMEGSLPFFLLTGIEVFSIWHYVVIAIGVAQVSKLSKAKSGAIIAALCTASILLSTGMQFFAASMAGK